MWEIQKNYRVKTGLKLSKVWNWILSLDLLNFVLGMQNTGLSLLIYEFFWKRNWAYNKTTNNINELVLHFRNCEWKKCEIVKIRYWKSEIQQRYLIKNAGKTDTTGQVSSRARVGSGAMTTPETRGAARVSSILWLCVHVSVLWELSETWRSQGSLGAWVSFKI